MTRDSALSMNFSHEGFFHLIPIYFREEDNTVAGKNRLYNLLVILAAWMDRLAMEFTGEDHFALYVRKL